MSRARSSARFALNVGSFVVLLVAYVVLLSAGTVLSVARRRLSGLRPSGGVETPARASRSSD